MKLITGTKMFTKGEIGENIVDEIIKKDEDKVNYAPISNCAHPVDRIVMSKDKKCMMIIEVKTINARDFYPDTGISIDHYNEYKYLQDKYSLPVWIFFVDEKKGTVYGNTLDKLEEKKEINHNGKILTYPNKQYNYYATGDYIIYFPLENMVHIAELCEEDISKLRDVNSEGYQKIIKR